MKQSIYIYINFLSKQMPIFHIAYIIIKYLYTVLCYFDSSLHTFAISGYPPLKPSYKLLQKNIIHMQF